MRRTCGVDRVVVGGLCGGAITGILAAAGHAHVAGVLGLGLPVMLDGSGIDKTRYMTVGQLDGIRSKYFGKLLDLRSWARVITLRTDFRLLWRSLVTPFTRRVAALREASNDARGSNPSPTQAPDNSNPLFPAAFRRLLADRRPTLLLFSESDRLYWEFREKYYDRQRQVLDHYADILEIGVVKEANHIFTFAEWQRQMLDWCTSWLERSFREPLSVREMAGRPAMDVQRPQRCADGVARVG
jgi:uncharacterized protein